ncbi:hypothetical protein B0T26DRAFT_599226, partial [Lasiosphaeria miniovina]
MAEVVGLVASVIAVVQLTAKVTYCCRFYIENVKDARKDLRRVLIETSSLHGVVDNLRFLLDSDPDFQSATELSALYAADGPVAGCLETLRRLEDLVPTPTDPRPAPPAPMTLKWRAEAISLRLAWPLKRNKVMALLDDLQRHKASVSLVIYGADEESRRDVKAIKGELVTVRQLLTANERLQFYDWLSQTNPSDIHNLATSQYEEGTGEWALRHPAWGQWLDPSKPDSRCVWLHGIPGAGKTVLAARLFSKLLEAQEAGGALASVSAPCIYYYCHHTRRHDEAPHFLRWAISRLCRQSDEMAGSLLQLYKDGSQPSLPQLLSALEASLAPYDAVFVVLDAMDESMPRERLLAVVQDLATDFRFAKMRLLAVSRVYVDIKAVMDAVATPLSMSNPFVEADIAKYVDAAVRRQRATTFRLLSDEFLARACRVIAARSQGMSRWAVCQLDVVRRLRWRDEEDLAAALDDLPRDLESTYERIFRCILEQSPPDDCQLVTEALAWISYNTQIHRSKYMSFRTLLAVVYPDHADALGPVLARRAEQVRDLLGCLVAVLRRDVAAVRILLDAGADPNGVGAPDGVPFDSQHPLSYFNDLHGASPLHVCRSFNFRCFQYDLFREKHYADGIEEMLVQRGARDFRLAEPGAFDGFGV